MMINEVLVIAMFVGVCVMLMGGFPVAFSLAGVALIFSGISYWYLLTNNIRF